MSEFERELQQTLRRREPARDLTPLIMAKLETAKPDTGISSRTGRRSWFQFRQWIPAIAAAAGVLILAGAFSQYQEYQKGQEAKRQLMVALGVTGQKLALAQEKINRLNGRRISHDR